MSANQDKSQKTEQPTPKRLRDARKKGQVAQSKEIVSSALILSILMFIWFGWDYYVDFMQEMISVPAQFYDRPFDEALSGVINSLFYGFVQLSLPFVIISIGVTVLASVLQFGLLFATEPLKPDFNKLNPVNGFKKIFSTKNLLEVVKSIVKVTVLSLLVFLVLRSSLKDLLRVPECDILCLTTLTAVLLKQLVIFLAPALIVIATVDYFLQKSQFIKDNRMTKDEVKREYKEMEGDPQIKGQRRQLQREIASEDIAQKVKTSTVILTSGANFAVVIWYERDTTPLPLIMLFGKDASAKQIVKVAHAADKPIVDDPALVRILIEKGQTDQYVPGEAIDQIAEVLRPLVPA